MKKVALLFGFALLGSVAHAVVIDSFGASYTNSVLTGTWVDVQTGSMLTGERDVQFEVLGNPFNQFTDLDINGSGSAVFSTGFGVDASFYFQYDLVGDEAGNFGPGKVLTNAGTGSPILSGTNDRVRVHFLGNDLNVVVTLTTRLSGSITGTSNATRLAGSGAGNLDLLMSPAILAAADSLTLKFSGATSADFAIDRVEAVPEPSSVLLLASGLVALSALRRFRR